MASRRERYEMSLVKRTFAATAVSAADDTGNAVSIGPMPQDPDQAEAVVKAMTQAGFKPMGWADVHTQEWLGDPRKIPANAIRKFGVKNIKPISLSNVSAASPGANLSKKIRVNFTQAGDAGAVKFAQRLDEMYGPWVDADMRNAKTFVIVSYDPAEMSPDLIVRLALRCGADKNSAVTTMSNVSAAKLSWSNKFTFMNAANAKKFLGMMKSKSADVPVEWDGKAKVTVKAVNDAQLTQARLLAKKVEPEIKLSHTVAAAGDSTSFDRYSKKIGNALADARTALKAAKTSIAALQTSGVSAPSGVNLDALSKYVTQAITVAMNASNELGMN